MYGWKFAGNPAIFGTLLKYGPLSRKELFRNRQEAVTKLEFWLSTWERGWHCRRPADYLCIARASPRTRETARRVSFTGRPASFFVLFNLLADA